MRERVWTRMPIRGIVLWMVCLWMTSLAASQEPSSPSTGTSRSGTGWTTSRIRGTPEPPPLLGAVRAYPQLTFKNPLLIARVPDSARLFGEPRLFVGEQTGKFYSFVNKEGVEKADLFLDLSKAPLKPEAVSVPAKFEATYGLVFPPDFETNRVCYVCYVVGGPKGEQIEDGSRVSRFKVEGNPPRAIPESEEVLITWLSGGHNGGDLHFGPDGCLYVSTGDGSFPNPPDARLAGQDVSNLLSSILRIDVRKADPGKKYAIPADNPFVDLPGARAEIWAYGFRNPWRMSFDPVTGDLWVGDVGWEQYETVHRIEKGGNYGWSIMEGPQPVRTESKPGPTPILPPAIAIPHSEGASVTGGYVYRGKLFPEIVGQYVFGDWETRRVWAATWDGKQVTARVDVVEPTVRVSAFGVDEDNEILMLDYDAGSVHRLVRNPEYGTKNPFPTKLSETGLFASVKDNQMAEGVVPFEINAPMWADYATAERFLALPAGTSITWNDSPKQIEGSMFSRTLEFPADAVLVKTLSLETTPGDPSTQRRMETQVLHYTGRVWRTYTYAWNDDQTDGTLVPDEGAEKTLTIRGKAKPAGEATPQFEPAPFSDLDPPGGSRTQTWTYHGRAACQRCHNPWAQYTLAFNVPQLNRKLSDGTTQLDRLQQLGLVKHAATLKPGSLSSYASPTETGESLERRARSYLHVNCSHCHRLGGGGTADLDLTFETPLDKTKLLGARPLQGTFGIHEAQLVAPADPYRSVLYFRISKIGRGRMPHIGSELVDPQGVALIKAWISSMPLHLAEEQLLARLRQLGSGDAAALKRTEKERKEIVSKLLSSTTAALMLSQCVEQSQLSSPVIAEVVRAGVAHPDLSLRDLFERYLPADQRTKTLGTVVRPVQILGMTGDPARGKDLFLKTEGVSCRNCHRVGETGGKLGPELTQIGKRLDKPKLLESILQPSKFIDPKYVPQMVETTQGKVVVGLLQEKTAAEVVLRDAQDKEIRIPAAEIEQMLPQRLSLMPDLLARDLTAQQLADLLAYLESLK